MRMRGFILLLGGSLFAAPLLTAAQELPSAPSAVQQQQQQQQQAPAPKASDPAPDPAPPQTETVSPASEPTPSQESETPKAPAAPPQAAPGDTNPDDTAATIRKTVNEVNFVFTVTDKHGHYVKNLTKEDFKVVDDSRPAAEIRSFHRENDLPLLVGLLVDASNSVRDRFKFEQESAIEFLNQTIRPRYDKAFVVGFDVTPEVTQNFTDNTEALSHGVRELRPGGGTAMYDALYFACRDKLLKESQNQTGPVRRAIILLSDGDDNQSHV